MTMSAALPALTPQQIEAEGWGPAMRLAIARYGHRPLTDAERRRMTQFEVIEYGRFKTLPADFNQRR